VSGRWAWAEVDLDAVMANVALLRDRVAPAAVWAVVKAGGYGHGAVPVARAALAAGAEGLCVALLQEGAELRRAGISAPVLVLSEQPPELAPDLVALGLVPTVYTRAGVALVADAVRAAWLPPYPVHLKVDTGMHRVGAAPDDAGALARTIADSPDLVLDGCFTHLAVADEPDDPYTAWQLERFDAVLADLASAGISPRLVHAANSAGGLAHAAARRSLVRCGIGIYGIAPGPGVAGPAAGLRPALSLHARVSQVKRLPAGARLSYGLRYRLAADATVATVPIGYADGVSRRLSSTGGEVLVGGRRRPIAGVVTMDQLMLDCGDDEVAVGDEVVLLGRQGDEEISAAEWADRLGTIGYEIVCGIGARVPRHHRGGPATPGPAVPGR
jgi:alanine racemase